MADLKKSAVLERDIAKALSSKSGTLQRNLLVAGLAGILIPILLQRLNVDPALASGAFVTTVTDVVGFFAFLGLAAMVLL